MYLFFSTKKPIKTIAVRISKQSPMIKTGIITRLREYLLSKMTINKILIYKGNRDEFESLLKDTFNHTKKIRFYLSKFDHDSFQIADVSSAGVIINYRNCQPITLHGVIQSSDNETIKIILKSRIRPEIYICCLITLISLIAGIINVGTAPFWPFLFPSITIPWFNWIYMIQHEALMEKAKVYFNLKSADMYLL